MLLVVTSSDLDEAAERIKPKHAKYTEREILAKARLCSVCKAFCL